MTHSMEEAVRLATFGWPEGTAKLRAARARVALRPAYIPAFTYDVAGAFASVPLFIAGDPSCMVDLGDSNRIAKPIIRLDYNIAAHSGTPASSWVTRGATVLGLVDQLESLGHSVELRIISVSSNTWGEPKASSKTIKWSAVVKRAGEILDLDRAAFAFLHPSVHRRFGFALHEQQIELEPTFSGTQGYPIRAPVDETSGKPGGAILVTGPQVHETEETALEAVRVATEAVLPTARIFATAA